MKHLPFINRETAGKALAREVDALFSANPAMDDPVVLALPRGGVPVAAEVARALRAPLDLVMVRKIGVPWHPELAAGAVADGDAPQVVLNADVVRAANLTTDDIDTAREHQLAEIDRRRGVYLKDRPRVEIAGRDAVVVDDGVATGATTEAALKATRARGPRSVTLAVPVAPRDTIKRLSGKVDHVVCLAMPAPFYAIGVYYVDFEQVADDEVVRTLDRFRP